jgi:hypothetical protein
LEKAHRLLSMVAAAEVLEEVFVALVPPTINNSHKVVVELATTSMDKVQHLNLVVVEQ